MVAGFAVLLFFCRDDPDANRDGPFVPNEVPRQWRAYSPKIKALNAFPLFQLFICFSLCNASCLVANSSAKTIMKGIRFLVERCFPELWNNNLAATSAVSPI